MSKFHANGKELIQQRKKGGRCLICNISLVPSHGISLPEVRRTNLGRICKRHNYELKREEVE